MIQIVYEKIINFCGIKEIPCVIVGSKVDLPQRYGFHSIQMPFRSPSCLDLTRCSRQVQPSEGEDLAKAIRSAWVETSAKSNVNVGESSFYSYPKRYMASIDVYGSQSL